MITKTIAVILFLGTILALSGCACKTCKTSDDVSAALAPQTTCPVSGMEVDRKFYVDYDGMRIYACCEDCVPKIKADPDKYIDILREQGQEPERIPALCPKCGEVKGTDKCCNPDAPRCDKCGKNKGAPGCCR